jgi:hypothetical protein
VISSFHVSHKGEKREEALYSTSWSNAIRFTHVGQLDYRLWQDTRTLPSQHQAAYSFDFLLVNAAGRGLPVTDEVLSGYQPAQMVER